MGPEYNRLAVEAGRGGSGPINGGGRKKPRRDNPQGLKGAVATSRASQGE